jgi:hypothetical protein
MAEPEIFGGDGGIEWQQNVNFLRITIAFANPIRYNRKDNRVVMRVCHLACVYHRKGVGLEHGICQWLYSADFKYALV